LNLLYVVDLEAGDEAPGMALDSNSGVNNYIFNLLSLIS
jgi:hypothetical protein